MGFKKVVRVLVAAGALVLLGLGLFGCGRQVDLSSQDGAASAVVKFKVPTVT